MNVLPDTVHSFRVDSPTACILNSYTPAGLPLRVDRETSQRIAQKIGMTSADVPNVLRTESDPRMK